MTKVVIFDFDGTIADSFNVFVESFEEVTKRPKRLTPTELENLRGKSIHELIDKLEIKKWQMPLLIVKGRRLIAAKMPRVLIFKGIPEVIRQLKTKDYKLYILSTNNHQSIVSFLKRYELNDYIDGIYAGTGLLGKAKRLKDLQKKEHLRAEEAIYVGDETRDIEAAQAVGIRCVAVSWGYSTPAALKSYKPTALAKTPGELLKILI